MPVVSIRVDEETARVLRKLARTSRKSRSEVIRVSLMEYAGRHADDAQESLLDRMQPYVGIIKDGPTDLSVDSGRKVREILRRKRELSR